MIKSNDPNNLNWKYEGDNARRFERHSVAYALHHRLYARKGKVYDKPWLLTTLKNISRSGLLFLSEEKYQSEDRIQMRLDPSDVEYNFIFHARVVRVNEQAPGLLYYVAADIDQEDHDKIQSILREDE